MGDFFTVTSNAAQWSQKIKGLAGQMPFAMALAATNTAKDIQAKVKQEIAQKFKGAVPFTLNAARVRPGNKSDFPNIKAGVNLGPEQHHYLAPEVKGGSREHKRFEGALRGRGILKGDEYVVPAKSYPLDGNGNIPSGIYRSILSQVGGQVTASKRKSKRSSAQYFAIPSGERGGAHPGIYQRVNAQTIKCVLVITSATPHYHERLPFQEIAHKVAAEQFPHRFNEALARALSTARR